MRDEIGSEFASGELSLGQYYWHSSHSVNQERECLSVSGIGLCGKY